MEIRIEPGKIFKILLFIMLVLLFCNLAGIILKYYYNHDYVFGLIRIFSFDQELSIPSLYSILALLSCTILLTIICISEKKTGSKYAGWLGLAIAFLYLTIDDSVMIHEELNRILKSYFNTSGIFYFVWIIPYLVLSILFVMAYVPFLCKLPKGDFFLDEIFACNILITLLFFGKIFIV